LPFTRATVSRCTFAASSFSNAMFPRESFPTALTIHVSAPSAAAWIATFAGAPPNCAVPFGKRSHSASPTPTMSGLIGAFGWRATGREARKGGVVTPPISSGAPEPRH